MPARALARAVISSFPNLAHVRDRSLIVVDVKDGEYFASREHREAVLGQRCIYLNPFNLLGLPNTRINPLQVLIEIVRDGGEIDTQTDEIAQTVRPLKPNEGESSWVGKESVRFMSGYMEYAAHFAPRCTLGGLWRYVNSSDEEMAHEFQMMASCGIESIARKAAAMGATPMPMPRSNSRPIVPTPSKRSRPSRSAKRSTVPPQPMNLISGD